MRPLMMRTRGTKPPQLVDCPCQIASLNQQAVSLNHAFTIISTAFETKRRSHSGNVFSRVYAKAGSMWEPLERFRERALSRQQASAGKAVLFAEDGA